MVAVNCHSNDPVENEAYEATHAPCKDLWKDTVWWAQEMTPSRCLGELGTGDRCCTRTGGRGRGSLLGRRAVFSAFGEDRPPPCSLVPIVSPATRGLLLPGPDGGHQAGVTGGWTEPNSAGHRVRREDWWLHLNIKNGDFVSSKYTYSDV